MVDRKREKETDRQTDNTQIYLQHGRQIEKKERKKETDNKVDRQSEKERR
jgi:hypothetical protein